MTEEEFYSLGEPEIDNAEPNVTEDIEVQTDNAVDEPVIEEEHLIDETVKDEETEPATDVDEPKPYSPFEGKTAEEIQQMFAQIQANRQAEAERQARLNNPVYQNTLGQVNPYTNKVIQTPEDFEEYKQEHEYRVLMQRMQSGQATRSEFNEFLKSAMQNMPEIQQATEAKKQADELAREAQRAKGISLLKADIDKFNAEMPSCKIKKVEDIQADSEVMQYINTGLSFDKAYKLAHMDDIINSKVSAVQQAAVTNQQNKAHITAVGAGNTPQSISVPSEVMQEYRMYFPDWTDKQIMEDYAKRI